MWPTRSRRLTIGTGDCHSFNLDVADTIDQMHAMVEGLVAKRLMYRKLVAL